MAFSIRLPAYLSNVGWKVKIQDKERCESPHVTIWFKRKSWRLNLRNGEFLDDQSWKGIDAGVRQAIEDNWQELRRQWNLMYGDVNPITSEESDR